MTGPVFYAFIMSFSRRTARLTGYAVVLLVLGSLVGLGAFMRRDAVRGPLILVHFPELATLSAGDPVVEQGVTIGAVEHIILKDGQAVATLRFHHHRTFSADTRFLNLSHSLMGARKVWVIPGTSPEPLDAASVQRGAFAPGLPETLHRVHELVEKITVLRTAADSLLGTEGLARLMGPLDAAHASLEAIAHSVEKGTAAVRAGLEGVTASAQAATRIAATLRTASPAAAQALGRADTLLAAAVRTETTLATALTSLETLVTTLSDTTTGPWGAGRLVNDRALYDSLLTAVRALDQTTRALKAGGLDDEFRIKPRLIKPRL